MSEEKLASWEKHTKGIGSKLLQKFGFSGRLGANESGIAKPIEVTVRPTNAGLGFGSAGSAQPDKKSFKSQEEQVPGEKDSKKRSGNFRSTHSGSRKQQKVSFKRDSIEDLLQTSQQATGLLGDDNESSPSEEEDKVIEIQQFRIGQPFKPPTNPVVEKLENLQYQKNRLEMKLSVLDGDIDETKRRQTDLSAIIVVLKQVDNFLGDIKSVYIDDENLGEVEFVQILNRFRLILKSFSDVFSHYQRECSFFGINRSFAPVFHQLFSMLFFSVETKRRFSRLTTVYDWCESFITEIQSFMVTLPHHIRGDLELSILPQILQQTVLQELLLFTSHEYNPVFHSQIIVDYLLTLSHYLPSAEIESFLKFAVVPQLMKFVQHWHYSFESGQYSINTATTHQSTMISGEALKQTLRGSDDYFLFHRWILPFFRLTDHIRQFAPLYPEIRKKIVQLVRNWTPDSVSDDRFLEDCELLIKLMAPWRDIFDRNSYDNLIIKMLIPKLHVHLEKSSRQEPIEENFCLEVLQKFQPIFSIEVLEICMISEFCRPKLSKLFRELRGQVDNRNNEASRLSLYLQLRKMMVCLVNWRTSIPISTSTVIKTSSRSIPLKASLLFEKATDFLDSFTEIIVSHLNEDEDGSLLPERLAGLDKDIQRFVAMLEQLHYNTLLKLTEDTATSANDALKRPEVVIHDLSSSSLTVLKDAIEQIALQMNVEFMPVKSVKSSGPVYRIGHCLICIQQETLCLHQKATNSWIPITPMELQEAVRSSL